MSTVPSPWNDACLAADLIAVDPAGLGGVLLRAQAGPARDAWLARWRGALPTHDPVHSIPLSVDDSRLLGGIDLTATLNAGRPVMQQGLLAQGVGGYVVLAMAERIARATAARVAAALDDRDRPIAAIACDEGGADEHVASALAERLGLQVDLAVGDRARTRVGPLDTGRYDRRGPPVHRPRVDRRCVGRSALRRRSRARHRFAAGAHVRSARGARDRGARWPRCGHDRGCIACGAPRAVVACTGGAAAAG